MDAAVPRANPGLGPRPPMAACRRVLRLAASLRVGPLCPAPPPPHGAARPCWRPVAQLSPRGLGWRLGSSMASSTSPPVTASDAAKPGGEGEEDGPLGAARSTAYPFPEIEARWQRYWEEHETFRTPGKAELDTSKPKYYVLDMFPYPSGAGLHVGHPEGYTATDIVARYKRMTGFNVLHPMGWDAFGLPAEQYAIETGTHPRETTARNVARFRTQLKALGFSYDWGRELSTTEPAYYRWTQWIFLRLLERGLAYQAEVPVNWCPALGTVLANEEVIDGKSERGGHPVVRRPMRQWMLRITAYADRLLADLDGLDWPESVKDMQRNWIGRSEGADIRFGLDRPKGDPTHQSIEVYTTRPETIFGATYLVLAPEHPLAVSLCPSPDHAAAVAAYAAAAASLSDQDRTGDGRRKTGVFTGAYCVNPASGARMPVWVADYVLGGYGAGAIMAVPAHDARDASFAAAFDLPVRRVVALPSPSDSSPSAQSSPGDIYTGVEGTMVGSDAPDPAQGLRLNGLGPVAAAAATVAWLETRGLGRRRTAYKLRDWLFARQRYWGEPFPVVFLEGDASQTPVPLPDASLPLLLPETDSFQPTGDGESPLAAVRDWVETHDPSGSGRAARRETSTMPQWAGSCWYYLRFADPTNPAAPIDKALEAYWLPVDLYVGGAEHSVLHLLYARFWHKVLHDIGVVSTSEPFARLVNQGMILGEVEYTLAENSGLESRPAGGRVAAADVVKVGAGYGLKSDPSVAVTARAHKMSKSRGNVVNPDDVVTQFGADSLRLYEMFLGPLRDTKTWSTRGVEGVHRFLARVHRLYGSATAEPESESVGTPPDATQLRALHECISRVTEELEALRFNTAISAMMEFVNAATKWPHRPREILGPFALLLSPFAPHLAEDCWSRLGHPATLAYEPWPLADSALLVTATVSLAVQVNGKTRAVIELAKGATEEQALAAASALPAVAKFLEGKAVKKRIFVADKILNLVVGPAAG